MFVRQQLVHIKYISGLTLFGALLFRPRSREQFSNMNFGYGRKFSCLFIKINLWMEVCDVIVVSWRSRMEKTKKSIKKKRIKKIDDRNKLKLSLQILTFKKNKKSVVGIISCNKYFYLFICKAYVVFLSVLFLDIWRFTVMCLISLLPQKSSKSC